jgi:hypothetical protein
MNYRGSHLGAALLAVVLIAIMALVALGVG